jgi:hypothetical protein
VEVSVRVFNYMSAVAVAGLSISASWGASVCDEQRGKAHGAISQQYAAVYKEIDGRVAQIISKGIDPKKFPYFGDDGQLHEVDMTALRSEIVAKQAQSVATVNDKIKKECDDQYKPIQDLTDFSMTVVTMGLSEVLPKRMTHVDVSQILSGKPLGGDSAAIPKAREQALDALGMGGKNNDIAKTIRDPNPVHVLKRVFKW